MLLRALRGDGASAMLGLAPARDDWPLCWWAFLSCVSVLNVVMLRAALRAPHPTAPSDEAYVRQMRGCAVVFTAACFLRSVWPRVDVERICFWGDGFLSTTLCGRSAAFCAEMCLAWQLGRVLGRINDDLERELPPSARSAGHAVVRWVARAIFPVLTCAQCCCWCGVLTTAQWWHGVEETLWMSSVGLIALCCLFLRTALASAERSAAGSGSGSGSGSG